MRYMSHQHIPHSLGQIQSQILRKSYTGCPRETLPETQTHAFKSVVIKIAYLSPTRESSG